MHRRDRVREVGWARQLRAPAFADALATTLATTGLAPERLMLELTETTLVDDQARTALTENIAPFGVRIALDDFGTGSASLSYLQQLPVDVVKVDRAFVSHLDDDGVRTGSSWSPHLVGHGLPQHCRGCRDRRSRRSDRRARLRLRTGIPLQPAGLAPRNTAAPGRSANNRALIELRVTPHRQNYRVAASRSRFRELPGSEIRSSVPR